MIELSKVSLKYQDGTIALQNIDLSLESGELLYITGPSGSGKTSLLKLLMGVEFPTTGHIQILERSILKADSKGLRKLRMEIGPVFQEFRLVKGRTALENVIMGMRFLDMTPKQVKSQALEYIDKVGLSHKCFSPVENLSWGEGQRIAIARAVARKPKLILADEPTGNLDKENALNILGLLKSFKQKDTTIIITTHATHLIEDEEEKILKIDKGSIFWERLGIC